LSYENALERLGKAGHEIIPDASETREEILDRTLGPDNTIPKNPQADEDGNFHGPRAAHSAAALLKSRRATNDPSLRVEENVREEEPAIRHRIRGDGPLTVKEAARGLAKSKEFNNNDPAYRDAMITLDRLVAGGADAREAQHDYDAILLAAEQKRARQKAGLEDDPAQALAEHRAQRTNELNEALQVGEAAQPEPVQPSQPDPEAAQRQARQQQLQEIEAARAEHEARQRLEEAKAISAFASDKHAKEAAAIKQQFEIEFADIYGLRAQGRHVPFEALPPERQQRARVLDQAYSAALQSREATALVGQAAHQAEFETFARQNDMAFEQSVKDVPKAELRAISEAAMEYLRTDLQMSDEQIGQAWNQPALRSVQGQRLLMAAGRQKLAEIRNVEAGRSLNQHRERVPPVMRSNGIRAGDMPQRSSHESVLNDRGATVRQQIRAGASMIRERRTADRERNSKGRWV